MVAAVLKKLQYDHLQELKAQDTHSTILKLLTMTYSNHKKVWHFCPLCKYLALFTLRPLTKNCHHFKDDIFKYIFLNKNVWTLPKISLKFVPNIQINHIPALVQIKAWYQTGDKSLSEPMIVSLLMHICVTGPQWVNEIKHNKIMYILYGICCVYNPLRVTDPAQWWYTGA